MGDYIEYNDDVQAIKQAILQSQYQAAKRANALQLGLYYSVGGFVSERVESGRWGEGALKAVSGQLQRELPGLRGFSERNLYYMKTFYEVWAPVIGGASDSALASAELPSDDFLHLQVQKVPDFPAKDFLGIGFTQHRTILEKVKDRDERFFYIRCCAHEHCRVEDLRRAIKRDDYHHQGQMPNNFLATMPSSQRALRVIETFKDEYLLDYMNTEELGVRDLADVDERVAERTMIQDVKNFIMAFGRGFTFVGNQYHLDAFGEDQYIDLLFFNRDLNCLVAVELKCGPFKTAYLGQLSGYLAVLDKFEKKEHENPSIGVVLCKDMNKAFVNLVIQSYTSPIGVATYLTPEDIPHDLQEALPDIDDLKALLEKEGE